MSCYVDELRDWGTAWLKTRRGKVSSQSCHLVADTLSELHAMAAMIGLKFAWFQDSASAPHYDLTPRRRAAAVCLGAQEVNRSEFVAVIRRIRELEAELAKGKLRPAPGAGENG